MPVVVSINEKSENNRKNYVDQLQPCYNNELILIDYLKFETFFENGCHYMINSDTMEKLKIHDLNIANDWNLIMKIVDKLKKDSKVEVIMGFNTSVSLRYYTGQYTAEYIDTGYEVMKSIDDTGNTTFYTKMPKTRKLAFYEIILEYFKFYKK